MRRPAGRSTPGRVRLQLLQDDVLELVLGGLRLRCRRGPAALDAETPQLVLQLPRLIEWSDKTNNPFSPLDSEQTAAAVQAVAAFYRQYAELLRTELKGD